MGGAVSSGRNNDDLIDNLIEADYIKTSLTARAFRAVDRAEYFLPGARANAYKDLAWKSGNLHLSAPCIYSEVMEGLNLGPGQSFLNLGSGTGYLSTMVGLILGSGGVNHGIEIHEDVVQYAIKKLEDFKKYSGAIDEYDFCEPKFIQGNCLCLTTECSALYDRVYCGAACPEQYESYMKNLLKIGGILVMPQNEQLLQIKRISQFEWTSKTLLPVSFASLISPPEDHQEWVQPIPVDTVSLQVICRAVIRNILRKNIELEHPPVRRTTPASKAPKKKRALRRLVVPLFDSDDSSEEERQVRLGGDRNRDAGRAGLRRDDANLFSFFLGGLGGGRNIFSNSDEQLNRDPTIQNGNAEDHDEAMETEGTNDSTEETENRDNEASNSRKVRAIIEHQPDPNENARQDDRGGRSMLDTDTVNEISGVIMECLNVLRRERYGANNENNTNSEHEDEETQESTPKEENGVQVDAEKTNDVAMEEAIEESAPSTSTDRQGKTKREKFDSGFSDEIIETQDSSEENEEKLEAISSADEEHSAGRRNKRGTDAISGSRKFRRVNIDQHVFSDTSSEEEADGEVRSCYATGMLMYESPFTERMKERIQKLPLPLILKRYLNFYREL